MRSALPYLLAGLLLAAGLVPGAVAQERNPPQSQPTPPPSPGGSSGPNSGSGQSPRSPGEELNHSGGVLQPPPTPDAGVVSPPSEGSSMPVIPPPGTPGGNPQLKPK
jgi:hypothetical protein